MGTEMQGRPEEPAPTLDQAEEWTLGGPLAPEARELDASLPLPGRQTSRIARLLARLRQWMDFRTDS